MAVAELELLEPLVRLSRDLKAAHRVLGDQEVRFLVDLYYSIQDNRERAGSQRKTLAKGGEPSELYDWIFNNMETLESDIKRVLDPWSMSRREGRWLRSIHGIGPVISSGLLAHINIERAPTVGHIWRYAGLDPTVTWEKGQKRPWNAALKVLCWKAGDSFVKVHNSDKDIYGHVYAARKELEIARSVSGESADDAAAMLSRKKFNPKKEALGIYESGQLPDGHLDSRARRYAVKLLLAHLHHVMYETRFGVPPPKPYVIAILGHANFIGPPGWPIA